MSAFTRLSSRTLRRTPLRTAAILAFVVIPVAAATVGLSLVAGAIDGERTSEDQRFGRADLMIEEYGRGETPPSIGEVAQREGLDPDLGVRLVERPMLIGDELNRYTEADLRDPMLEGLVELRSGRLPERVGEAVVTIGVGDADGQRLQGRIDQAGGFSAPRQEVRIVGVVTNRERPSAVFVYPGTIQSPLTSSSVSFQGDRVLSLFSVDGGAVEAQRIVEQRILERVSPPTTTGEAVNAQQAIPRGSSAIGRQTRNSGTNRSQGAYFMILAAAVVVMTWTSMVIGSGLSISAARRRRELGILGINGADPSALRRAVRSDGLVLGVVGSTLGVALAVPVAVLVNHLLYANSPLTTVQSGISPWLVMAPIIGVASAVFAGSIAANGVSRQSIADLLAARTGPMPGRPIAKLVGLALVAAIVGTTVASLLVVVPVGPNRTIVFLLSPIAAAFLVAALPAWAIQWLPRLVRWAGPTVRLAARDLQRFGSRTAAATAAIALTLSVAAAAAAVTAPPGPVGSSVLNDSETITIAGTSPLTLTVNGAGLEAAEGELRSGKLSSEEISAIREAVGDRAIVQDFIVAKPDATGLGVVACADNPQELFPTVSIQSNSCLPVTPVLVKEAQLSKLPVEIAEPLRANLAVAWSSTPFPATPLNPRLQFGDRTLPLETPRLVTSPELAGATYQGMLGLSGGIEIAVPPALWESSGLASLERPIVVVRSPEVDNAAAAALYRSVVSEIGEEVNTTNVSWDYNSSLDLSTPKSVGPPIRGWVAAGVVLLVMLLLALSLGLVRLETRQEETTLIHQGATPRQRAAVIAWRATLAVGVAAVVAVAVVGPLVAAATVNTGVRWLPWYWALGLLVCLPALAFALFYMSGLRSSDQDHGFRARAVARARG